MFVESRSIDLCPRQTRDGSLMSERRIPDRQRLGTLLSHIACTVWSRCTKPILVDRVKAYIKYLLITNGWPSVTIQGEKHVMRKLLVLLVLLALLVPLASSSVMAQGNTFTFGEFANAVALDPAIVTDGVSFRVTV